MDMDSKRQRSIRCLFESGEVISGFGEEHHIGLGDDTSILHPILEVGGSRVSLGIIDTPPVGQNSDLIRVAW